MSETATPATGAGAGEGTYVRKGFGLKAEVQDTLAADYTGHLVDLLRARDYTLTAGNTTVRLAKEFGFCYGVERAVDYAYQTRRKFPDRRIFLAGEIIHNPHVNAKLQGNGHRVPAAERQGFRLFGGGAGGRGDPSGVRRDDPGLPDAARAGLRGGGHDLRLGAERVEARRGLRAGRLHLADPRQVLPRGDARDGVAGGEVPGRPVPHRARHGRGGDW